MSQPEPRVGTRKQRKNWSVRAIPPWKSRKIYRCAVRFLRNASDSMRRLGNNFTEANSAKYLALLAVLGEFVGCLHKTPPLALEFALRKMFEFPLTEAQREEITQCVELMYSEIGRILSQTSVPEGHIPEDSPETGLEFTDYAYNDSRQTSGSPDSPPNPG